MKPRVELVPGCRASTRTCFGCTPGLLPELLAGALRGADPVALADRLVPAKS